MRRSSRPLACLAVVLVGAGACGSDLGECDLAAATVVVYRGGVPHYEGQALVESRCAGGFCHSAGATGSNRFGVPAGLNFDVPVVTPALGLPAVEKHRKGLDAIGEWAEEMYDQVAEGNMPPGEAGKRDPGVWVHAAVDGSLPVGGFNELFDVDSDQGKETLRNWLACGPPTVTGTDDLDATVGAAVATLGGAVLPAKGDGGTCSPTATGALVPVLDRGACSNCHSMASPFFGATTTKTLLDLSRDKDGGVMAAYLALFDRDSAASGACGGRGKLIGPGKCADSVLYRKLAGGPLLCGGQMPLGSSPLDVRLIDCLCQWIDAGAPMN